MVLGQSPNTVAVAVDTLLYKEDSRSCIERSTNTGLKVEQGNHVVGEEEKHVRWKAFSGHCKFKFPLKPPPALRDYLTTHLRRKGRSSGRDWPIGVLYLVEEVVRVETLPNKRR
ncbi:uncharacterized protein L199_000842 [Kwoniella botswanensis]|uniref:uncharacterized protein n=1 Tax=Kwoniella botswanensis TaxID=1268659 RepID=UPI00315D0DBC